MMRLIAMPCKTTHAQPKILSIVQCKLLQSLIRNCLRTSYDLSSEDESTYYDLNTKHMILKELRRRAMRASSKSNEHLYSLYQTSNYDNINQFHQKRTGRQLDKFQFNGSPNEPVDQPVVRSSIYNTDINTQKEKIEEDNNFADNETESFFSAKTNFSSSSSQSTIIAPQSMLEQFKHLEGWPFGLLRRPIVQLPPLPPTPANSWLWLRRNSQPKAEHCYLMRSEYIDVMKCNNYCELPESLEFRSSLIP